MFRDFPLSLRLAALWIVYCAWSAATGWILSMAGQLNVTGYSVALVPLAAAVYLGVKPKRGALPRRKYGKAIARRLRKSPAFLLWAVVAVLILAGGVLNPPTNYDGITYRFPRLLFWLQEHRWHWINGIDFRLDIAGSGFEWMMAPLLVFTGGDRLLFLLNYLPFLLLPGFFFVAARGLGISPRQARWWMWVWPMAYGITVQAASVGNDITAGALAMASLAFAARASRGNAVLCLALSAVAASLMTGIKVTSVALGLPLAIFWIYQAWRLADLKRLGLVLSGLAPLLMLVSFVPTAYLCWKETGAWNGNPGNRHGIETSHPVAGIVGNGINLTMGTICPPVLPGAGRISAAVSGAAAETSWFPWVKERYASFGIETGNELPSEEGAGIGLGITLLALAWGFRGLSRKGTRGRASQLGIWFVVGTGIAMLVFMAKLGGNSTSRLMVPFIPFMILSFLILARTGRSMLSEWWVLLPALFLLPTLLLNPNRPLLPYSRIASLGFVPASLKSRIEAVSAGYTSRNNMLANFQAKVPEGGVVGFGGGGDQSAYSLFRPLGRLKVYDLSPPREKLAGWVVGTRIGIERRMGMPLEEWAGDRFEKVYGEEIVSKVKLGPEEWMLFRRISN